MNRALIILALLLASGPVEAAAPWRAVQLSPTAATDVELASLKKDSTIAIALCIRDGELEEVRSAAARVTRAGLELHYWFEIGRNPALAEAHPAWMASIQGHQEWRRFFPDFAQERENQVVKAYPWVPVAYEESFNAHSQRVLRQLSELPQPAALWLNNLQGPPAVCGCGHPLCRWTTDYGPKVTATALGDDAAARFVRAIQNMSPKARVIPVWATECEAHDQDDLCAGVACYTGRCWKDWTKQLMPLAEAAPTIGVLATYKILQRDLPRYGSTAGWVGEAVRSFQSMPPHRGGTAVPAARLVAVVQGWNVSARELAAQIDQARQAAAAGIVIVREPLEQSWTPRLIPSPPRR